MLGGIGGRKRRGRQRMRWLDGITWLNGRESEWTPGVGDGQGGLACCDSWGRKESGTTEQLNWTDLTNYVPETKISDSSRRDSWRTGEILIKSQLKKLFFLERNLFVSACLWVNGMALKRKSLKGKKEIREPECSTILAHEEDWLPSLVPAMTGFLNPQLLPGGWLCRDLSWNPEFWEVVINLTISGLPPVFSHLLCWFRKSQGLA